MDFVHGTAAPETMQQQALKTTDPQVAAVLMVFGAKLCEECSVTWLYVHESRESFLRNVEDKTQCEPEKKRIFNFENGTIPATEIIKAIGTDLESIQAELEMLLAQLDKGLANQLRDCVSKLIARSCKEALVKRNEIAHRIEAMPESAKWDYIKGFGKRFVQMGKISSPELRAHFLEKL